MSGPSRQRLCLGDARFAWSFSGSSRRDALVCCVDLFPPPVLALSLSLASFSLLSSFSFSGVVALPLLSLLPFRSMRYSRLSLCGVGMDVSHLPLLDEIQLSLLSRHEVFRLAPSDGLEDVPVARMSICDRARLMRSRYVPPGFP